MIVIVITIIVIIITDNDNTCQHNNTRNKRVIIRQKIPLAPKNLTLTVNVREILNICASNPAITLQTSHGVKQKTSQGTRIIILNVY